MPYIKTELRNYLLTTSIQDLLKEPKVLQAGELNFLISTLIWSVFESNPCYQKANEILGVLSAVTWNFTGARWRGMKIKKFERTVIWNRLSNR